LDKNAVKRFFKGTYTVWKCFLWGLRWLSIVAFGVLFFTGIYFELPWKVLVCLAVIPAVGIFVPRKIQPWVWMGLTLFLLVVWGWVNLPEHNSSRWRVYQYDKALAEIERDYLPEGMENAADLYQPILDTYSETIFYYSFSSPQEDALTLSQPWDPAAYPQLDAWMLSLQPAIERLSAAARVEQCRFEIPYNLAALKPQMERINRLKGWARLLLRAANRDLYLGHQEQALEKMLAVVNLSQHLYQQQTLFDQAGAFYVELMGARALETYLVRYCENPDWAVKIEDVFEDLNPRWTRNWPHILQREKLLTKNIAALLYEVNEAGRIRISHNAAAALQEGLGYPARRLFLNQHQINRLAVIGLWLSLPMSPQRLAQLIDKRFDYYSLQVQKGQQLPNFSIKYVWTLGLNAQSIIDWLAMQQVGYFWALDGQYRRHQAIVRQMHLFSGLKRYFLQHGQWPERLEHIERDSDELLIDPLTSRPFVYERLDSEFRLYSLGPNGVDDGGINHPKLKKDDILLWPRKTTQQDNVRTSKPSNG